MNREDKQARVEHKASVPGLVNFNELNYRLRILATRRPRLLAVDTAAV